MSGDRRLRLIPYTPTDYSLGEPLVHPNETVLTDPEAIGAALSLYFQWREHRSATFQLVTGDSTKRGPCEIAHNPDESRPTELTIAHSVTLNEDPTGVNFCVLFEVFGVCYEFTTRGTAAGQATTSHFTAIVDVPSAIVVRRRRTLPRIELDSSEKLVATWTPVNSRSTGQNLSVRQMSLGGLLASPSSPAFSERQAGRLSIGGLEFQAVVTRVLEEEIAFAINFESELQYGRYFDLYRRFAYPSLRSRAEFSTQIGLNLYSETNYFGKYEGEKTQEERSEIADTWDKLEHTRHLANADYYVVDASGSPTGASGVALASYDGDQPLWVFHQLCALKRPELIVQSGILYTWRTEYLAGRPHPLTTAVWFHSKSRWLERLYVKHALFSEGRTSLLPVVDRRCRYSIQSPPSTVKIRKYEAGNNVRIATSEKSIWAGINPKYLNANQNLDVIVALDGSIPPRAIASIGSRLCQEAGLPSADFLVTVPASYDADQLGGKSQLSDRIAIFPKSELIPLMSSIEHSVAITNKKLNDGKAK